MINFNYYGADVENTRPLGMITLERFISAIKHPKQSTLDTLEKVRYYSKLKNENKRAEYKRQLFFFTPAVLVNGRRRYADIKSFTGILVIDFDKLDSVETAIALKTWLFTEHRQVICSWLSSSGLGVRALVKIPICYTVDEYKAYFRGFYNRVGFKIKGWDDAPQNAVLPLFISVDKDMLYRTDYTEFTEGYIEYKKPQGITLYKTANPEVNGLIEYKINQITSDGHPQLRAISYALGGYVASGYISSDEAESLIEPLIRNNGYLGVKNKVEGYIKTAKTMIRKGQNEPLTITK